MITSKIWSEDEEEAFCSALDKEIVEAWDRAMSDPYPKDDSTKRYVWHQNTTGE